MTHDVEPERHPNPVPSAEDADAPDPLATFTFGWFFFGLLIGTLVSAILYYGRWSVVKMADGTPIFTDLFVKILIGFACLCFQNWRGFGTGILISIVAGLVAL